MIGRDVGERMSQGHTTSSSIASSHSMSKILRGLAILDHRTINVCLSELGV